MPVPVAGDVPEELKIWIDEHAEELPGVAAERVAVRRYPYGQLAAHVLGYTGQIIDEEFEAKAGSPKPYTLNDKIGKYGVEKIYEDDLRGTPGSRSIEVDAENQPIRIVERGSDPIPGDDLVLNLDIDVQAQAEQALQSGLAIAKDRPCTGCQSAPKAEKGSTVVLDPKTGGVIAMASYPTFNPADFVDGISDIEWAALTAEENNTPLNNWAIQGQYAPGLHLQALQRGGRPRVRAHHPRHHRVRRRRVRGARLHRRLVRVQQRPASKSYGVVDLRRSLTVSSDFYYYGLGAQFWIQQDRLGGPERYADLLKQWGFDSDTGIDLSSEQSGRIPSPAWLAEYCEDVGCVDGADSWRTGNNVNMAIGQGDVLLTPLQLASGYATIGNGGTVWQPHVVKEVRDGVTKELKRTIEPKELNKIELTPEWRQALFDGLTGVTTSDGGTAVGAFSGFPHDTFPIAAKTGTAQVRGPAARTRRPPRCSAPTARPPTRSTPSRCCSRRPATAARWRRRSPAASSTCCATPSSARPRPRAAGSRCSTPSPRPPGTCATDGRTATPPSRPASGSRPARSAACRATRPRRGGTSTWCWWAASSRWPRSARS